MKKNNCIKSLFVSQCFKSNAEIAKDCLPKMLVSIFEQPDVGYMKSDKLDEECLRL